MVDAAEPPRSVDRSSCGRRCSAIPPSEEAINVVLEDELLISDAGLTTAAAAAAIAPAPPEQPKPGGLRDRLNLGRGPALVARVTGHASDERARCSS